MYGYNTYQTRAGKEEDSWKELALQRRSEQHEVGDESYKENDNEEELSLLEIEQVNRNERTLAFDGEEENLRKEFDYNLQKTDLDQDHPIDERYIDDLAKSIRKNVRGFNKSIKAVKAYRELKTLSVGEIEYFHQNYTYLWDKVIDNLPKEFIESDEFGIHHDLNGATAGKTDFDLDKIEKTRIKGSGVIGNNFRELVNPFKKVKEYNIDLGKVTKALGPKKGATFSDTTSLDLPKNISQDDIGQVTIVLNKNNREIHITASALPIKVNYQAPDYNFHLDESIFQGLDFCMEFPEKKQDDQTGYVYLNLDRLVLNNMRIFAEDYSFSIKKLEIKDLKLRSTQTLGYKFGIKNSYLAISTLLDYISLLQNVSMLLVSGMSTNQDMGSAIDTFKELLTNSFLHNVDLDLSIGELAIEDFSYTDKIDGTTEIKNLTTTNEKDKSSIDLKIKAKGVEESDFSKLFDLKTQLAKEKELLAKLEKRAAKGTLIFKNRLARTKIRIKELTAEIVELQKNLVFETEADVYGLQTSELGYAKYLNDTLEDYVQGGIEGSENAKVEHIGIKSTIGPESIKDTKITLSNVTFDKLFLSGINYNDKKSLSLTAANAEMMNVTTSLELYIKSASVQTDGENRSIQATPTLIYISDFEAEQTSVSGGVLSLLEQNLTAEIGYLTPAVLDCLKMTDFYIDLDAVEGEKAIPKSQRELLSLSLDAYRSGKGDMAEMKDKLGRTVLSFTMQDVVVGGITLNTLKEGGIDYELKTLSGSTQIDVTKYDPLGQGTTQTSILNFPGLLPSSNQEGQQSALSGSYQDGKITLKAYLPELLIPKLDLGDKSLSFKAEGGHESKLLGITVEFEYTPEIKPDESTGQKGVPASTNLKKVHIEDSILYGLQISMFTLGNKNTGEKDTLQTISFPKNLPTTIKGLELIQFRMEKIMNNDGALSWQYKPEENKEAIISTKGVTLPKGIQYQNITQKTKVTLQNGSWDSSSFTLLENGGIKYSFENLDALFSVNQKGDQEVNSTVKIDSESIEGSYREEAIGTGKNLKKRITLSNTIKINELRVPKLNINDGKTKIYTSEITNGATIKNINANLTVTIITPSVNEKEKAVTEKKEIKDDITVNINKLDIEQLTIAGMTLEQKINKKDDTGKIIENKKVVTTFPQQMPATINLLSMNDFVIHQQSNGKTTHKGTVTAGNTEKGIKGLDLKGIDYQNRDFLKNTVDEVFGFPLTTNKITYTFNEKGETSISIDDPHVLTALNSSFKFFENYQQKNHSEELMYWDRKTGSKDLIKADKIEVNIDNQGKLSMTVTKPEVSPFEFRIPISKKPGEIKEIEVFVGGKIDGILKIEEGDELFEEFVTKDKKDKSEAIIISADNDIVFSKSQLTFFFNPAKELSQGQIDKLPKSDWDAYDQYNPTNDFNFLDAATGSVTITMFGEEVKMPIVNSISDYDYQINPHRESMPKKIYKGQKSIPASINIAEAIEKIETILEGDNVYYNSKGEKIEESRVKDNPGWALTNLEADRGNDNDYVLEVSAIDKDVMTIVPNYRENVFESEEKRYVKLSALVDYQTKKPMLKPYKEGEDSNIDRAMKDVDNMLQGDFLNLKIDVNAKINMSQLKDDDPKKQSELRGLLNFISSDEDVSIKSDFSLSHDRDPLTNKKSLNPIVNILNFKLPEFRYPVKDNKGEVNKIISGDGVTASKIVLKNENNPLKVLTANAEDLSIKGLKIKLKK